MIKALYTLKSRFCATGLILGSFFFATSFTPSLIPRSYDVQGILAGIAFSMGYGIGVFLESLWRYLELPGLTAQFSKYVRLVLFIACLLVILMSLYHAADWQNSVRSVLGMAPVESAYPVSVCGIAIVSFAFLLFIARGLIGFGRIIVSKLHLLLPRRVSAFAGVVISTVLVIALANGVLIRYTFRMLDRSFQQIDALIEPDRPQPLIAERAGNPDSKLIWGKLGRAGREFVASGPTAKEISQFNATSAIEPIRLYAGLQVAETPNERAEILLDELVRLGAFNRAALVIITPTGTGWVDPSAIDGLEFLLNGNVASVALQYSYLNSPLSLTFQPDNGLESSRALFRKIYSYWKRLPEIERPKLYLHGLSLGALNSQRSITFFDILGDPINGAVWSGSPFPSELWRSLTNERDPNSAEWLPVFQQGRFVRFMNQYGLPKGNSAPWGKLRVVFLQYASDAVTFFDKSLAYREADWMKDPRGPDVSPLLKWYPFVSFLQLLIDMPLSDTVPMGYGHAYAPEHYLNAWLEVTGTDSWTEEDVDKLKEHLKYRSSRNNAYIHRGG